jgi:hypothetical protein
MLYLNKQLKNEQIGWKFIINVKKYQVIGMGGMLIFCFTAEHNDKA